jgi:DNA polymerase V
VGFRERDQPQDPALHGPRIRGLPFPADDFIDKSLDLNEFLIEHPSATFFVRAEGTSMIGAGIHPATY